MSVKYSRGITLSYEGSVTLVRTGISDLRQGHQHGQEQQNIDSGMHLIRQNLC